MAKPVQSSPSSARTTVASAANTLAVNQPKKIPNEIKNCTAHPNNVSTTTTTTTTAVSTTTTSSKKKKKHKKKSKATVNNATDFATKTQADMVDAMMNHHVIRHNNHSDNTIASSSKPNKKKQNSLVDEDGFWSSTNNTQERQKIREFWLQLGEDERRSLVKVEKEAVLRKMKEQQKHSCNCSVCGKKRTAIEDELEVLYDAYYEELEQYANHQQQSIGSMNPLHAGHLSSSDPLYDQRSDDTDPLEGDEDGEYDDEEEDDLEEDDEEEDDDDDEEEEEDEEDEDEDDEDDEEEEEEEEEDDDDFDDDDDEIITRPPIATYAERSRFEEMAHIRHAALSRASTNGDHFSFGNSLTVKGGILTVADDLLKNDGKKFLDMMERLAERRMQKDYMSDQSNGYFQEDEDDEEAFEGEGDDDEDTRTEEQRVEEGRHMFQIFAARMFEQRVLAAYREKVAQERQQRLLEELEEEDRLREEREAKKQKERERKKDKKKQMKQKQEEERLAHEAEKIAKEETAKREREMQLEIERQKREKERLKKEEERRHREEERLRKEEEKKRRAREEKERVAERERKRKEKEEKEEKEKERLKKERIEKEHIEKERIAKERIEKERLEKQRLEKERLEKEKIQKAKAGKDEKEEQAHLKREAATIAKQQAAAVVPLSEKPVSPIKSAISSSIAVLSPSARIQELNMPIDDPENRQQVLIEALVGPRSSFMDNSPLAPSPMMAPPPSGTVPLRPPHLQSLPTSFMPNHLDVLKGNFLQSPPSLDHHTSPLGNLSDSVHGSASMGMIGLFSNTNNFVAASLEPSISSRSRSLTPIAPIGQPVNGRRVSSVPLSVVGSPINNPDSCNNPSAPTAMRSSIASPFDPESGSDHGPRSFFSSFLFGEPNNNSNSARHHFGNDYDIRFPTSLTDRRFSSDIVSSGNDSNHWANGWTTGSVISENAHGKLFGDALPDRTTMMLERAKVAYQKLDEITQTRMFTTNQYHTLVQLHCMMNDLYIDHPIDIRELYEVLLVSPTNGFQCLNHPQHGMVVLFEPNKPQNHLFPSLPPSASRSNTILTSPFTTNNNNTSHSLQGVSNPLFGNMS